MGGRSAAPPAQTRSLKSLSEADRLAVGEAGKGPAVMCCAQVVAAVGGYIGIYSSSCQGARCAGKLEQLTRRSVRPPLQRTSRRRVVVEVVERPGRPRPAHVQGGRRAQANHVQQPGFRAHDQERKAHQKMHKPLFRLAFLLQSPPILLRCECKKTARKEAATSNQASPKRSSRKEPRMATAPLTISDIDSTTERGRIRRIACASKRSWLTLASSQPV